MWQHLLWVKHLLYFSIQMIALNHLIEDEYLEINQIVFNRNVELSILIHLLCVGNDAVFNFLEENVIVTNDRLVRNVKCFHLSLFVWESRKELILHVHGVCQILLLICRSIFEYLTIDSVGITSWTENVWQKHDDDLFTLLCMRLSNYRFQDKLNSFFLFYLKFKASFQTVGSIKVLRQI